MNRHYPVMVNRFATVGEAAPDPWKEGKASSLLGNRLAADCEAPQHHVPAVGDTTKKAGALAGLVHPGRVLREVDAPVEADRCQVGELQGNGVELDTWCTKLGFARDTLKNLRQAMEADATEAK
jgi:hypothetical protein